MNDSDFPLMPLEFLILFCVKLGFRTSYSIWNEVGVSVGASSPTLKRLEKKEFLASSIGRRRRQAYSLTKRGEDTLRNGLAEGPDVYGRPTPGGFYESLRRVIFFSWVKGELAEGRRFLDEAKIGLSVKSMKAKATADQCLKLLNTQQKDPILEVSRRSSAEYVAAGYRLICAVSDSVDTEIQLRAVAQLARLIEKLPPGPDHLFGDIADG